jgi:hypothetical protein
LHFPRVHRKMSSRMHFNNLVWVMSANAFLL